MNIENKILESARTEAESVVTKAKERARKRVQAAGAENKARYQKALDAARAALEQEHGQKTTSARAASNLKLLTHKTEILDQVFKAAVECFIGDRGKEYRKWLAARLKSVATERGAVLPAEADREIIGELLSNLAANEGLSLAEDSASLRGGFLVRGEKADFDLSLDTELEQMKTQLLPELARRAFGGRTAAEHYQKQT